MIEVLVSVVVLGLVVTASLKLAALSEKALGAVREREALLDEVSKAQVMLTIDPLNSFGRSGDLEWRAEDQQNELRLDERIDISALAFNDDEMKAEFERFQKQALRWRELHVAYRGSEMMIFLPYSEEAAAMSMDVQDLGSLPE